MLFFSLAENTNFSAPSHSVAEGTEFTISLFTIMALTFQGNELGGKEQLKMPSDTSTGLAAAANYLAGRKISVPGIRRRVCELWRLGKALWCLCHANRRTAPPDLCLTFTSSPLLSRHVCQLWSQTRWKVPLATDSLQGRRNASGIIPWPGQRRRINRALLCVANIWLFFSF